MWHARATLQVRLIRNPSGCRDLNSPKEEAMSDSRSASIVRISGNTATILFAVVALIQLLVAAGVLPITMAWGGRHEVLTPGLRIASVASAVILCLFAYVIRHRAGLVRAEGVSVWIKVFAWIATAFMAFNTFTNLTSQSATEKIVFVPITSVLAIVCFVVSISRRLPVRQSGKAS